ncbi:uncharacterized protein LOC133182298 [Saccostrea echinata]|uniref:uncharacterized protein LOC133182298 n=1 Tax=Saccostrea echinata TaxID=191078 RepID=UPI002A8031B8|nr:uncharacterized protein LOC133182298 [Saccostrea echinata]
MDPPKIVITKEKLHGGSLIRKTSIRRRVSLKEDRRQEKYGNLTGEYTRIKNTMLLDRGVQNTLESLQERWRMIMFMYDDCVEMFKTRRQKQFCRRQLIQRRELIACVIIYSALVLPVLIAIFLTYVIAL